MPWTGSAPNKTYVRSDGVRTGAAINVTAANNGVNNTASLADARENDSADGLNLAMLRDGGNQPTADLPMGSHKFTSMGAGSARTDSIRLGQVQDGALVYAEASGTANAIVLTTTPSCSPVEGMVIGFVAEADSTSTVTIDLNGGGALALQVGGAACAGGEINNGQFHQVGFDGTQWQLLNPWGPALFQPLDADLTAIAALTTTSFGRSVLTAADAAALATLAGIGTGDSPQITAVNLGNASDTTLTRSAAGRLAVEGKDALLKGQTDTLTKGYNATENDAGTKSSGTFTPDPADGNFQKAVNGGAHTLAPPGSTCSIVIQYTNNGSAGAITTSSFTKVTGDSFTTTNGDDFLCYIVRNNGFSHLHVTALQ